MNFFWKKELSKSFKIKIKRESYFKEIIIQDITTYVISIDSEKPKLMTKVGIIYFIFVQ